MPLYFMYAPHGLRLHGILMPLRLAGRLWYPPRFDSGVRCLRHQLAVLTVARRDNRPFWVFLSWWWPAAAKPYHHSSRRSPACRRAPASTSPPI
jgi:hypothetical protein